MIGSFYTSSDIMRNNLRQRELHKYKICLLFSPVTVVSFSRSFMAANTARMSKHLKIAIIQATKTVVMYC